MKDNSKPCAAQKGQNLLEMGILIGVIALVAIGSTKVLGSSLAAQTTSFAGSYGGVSNTNTKTVISPSPGYTFPPTSQQGINNIPKLNIIPPGGNNNPPPPATIPIVSQLVIPQPITAITANQATPAPVKVKPISSIQPPSTDGNANVSSADMCMGCSSGTSGNYGW